VTPVGERTRKVTVNAPQDIDRDTYSLLITCRMGSEVLCLTDGPCYSLPIIDIPRWQRIAEQINNTVNGLWNLDAYSVCTLLPDSATDACSSRQFQVMESLRPEQMLPKAARWVPVSALVPASFRDSEHSAGFRAALGSIAAYAANPNLGPFARPGWLRDLFGWIQDQLDPLNLRLTGPFRQLTASPTFSLIRFETNGPAVWFKAVGGTNVREYGIITALAPLFPFFLPRIIATRPEWSAWLTIEADGTSPDADSDFAVWNAVSTKLAALQVASLQQTDRLLSVGCRDLSVNALLNCVDEFFATMQELMRRQTKTPPPILTSGELLALADRVKQVLSGLAASGIPATLNHLDFNPGNVLVYDRHCIFIDWAEAAIGHPFLTFEYLLEYFTRLCPERLVQRADLISTYLEKWDPYVSLSAASRCLSLTPLAAIFAHATSNRIWRDPARLANPHTEGYFRSLTRRMKREADALETRNLECVQR